MFDLLILKVKEFCTSSSVNNSASCMCTVLNGVHTGGGRYKVNCTAETKKKIKHCSCCTEQYDLSIQCNFFCFS